MQKKIVTQRIILFSILFAYTNEAKNQGINARNKLVFMNR